jgi:hypothetical protein
LGQIKDIRQLFNKLIPDRNQLMQERERDNSLRASVDDIQNMDVVQSKLVQSRNNIFNNPPQRSRRSQQRRIPPQGGQDDDFWQQSQGGDGGFGNNPNIRLEDQQGALFINQQNKRNRKKNPVYGQKLNRLNRNYSGRNRSKRS